MKYKDHTPGPAARGVRGVRTNPPADRRVPQNFGCMQRKAPSHVGDTGLRACKVKWSVSNLACSRLESRTSTIESGTNRVRHQSGTEKNPIQNMEFHFVWERTPLGIGLRPALYTIVVA